MGNENIAKLYELTAEFFMHDTTGHDWWHVKRVTAMAVAIAKKEKADLSIVEPAAMVHDADDWKLSGSNEGFANAKTLLTAAGYSPQKVEAIIEVVSQVSFKGAGVSTTPNSLEAMVVQDADRLDAIGAIGIARAFAYGGSKNRPLHIPTQKPTPHNSFSEYKAANGTTINHFYEKLLLLKDRMNTKTARELAEERHRFMEVFLEQFYKEWDQML